MNAQQSSSAAGVPGDEYAAFRGAYTALAPLLYGIISRIVEDSALAESTLSSVFVCLSEKKLLAEGQLPAMKAVFPVLFDCVAKALRHKVPESEIQDRIQAERLRIIEEYRTAIK